MRNLWLASDATAWARFDPVTGALCEVPSPPDDRELSFGTFPQGRYARLDGTLVVLYGFEGQVRLRIGEVERACTSPASVHWVRFPDDMARLSLVDGSEIVASVAYFGGDPWGIPPELDFTMTDTEDFDFGEWVRRLLDDPDKVRTLAGGSVDDDPNRVIAPEARAALDALPVPTLADLRLDPFKGANRVDRAALIKRSDSPSVPRRLLARRWQRGDRRDR